MDRYRWRLLRERHSWLGSVLRFARDALSDCLFGWRAQARLSAEVVAEPCDFLLLQSATKVIAFQRKKLLITALRDHHYLLVETALQDQPTILARRLLKRPPQAVPLRYFGYAAYAEWLVAHHQPRILLNDRNGSLYAPFLRLALNQRQCLLVHLAHATTVESSSRLSMNDYDYYFMFGHSSLEALQSRPLRFGNSNAVLSGSHMIDLSYDLLPATPERRVLLVLGVGPDKEKEPGYQRTYALLYEWVSQHPEFQVLIKAHPRSQIPFWQKAALDLPHVQVLPPECSLAAALDKASIVINIMSNAVIEAALARRPIIYVNASEHHDIFSQERFLGRRVATVAALSERIVWIQTHYRQCLEEAERFAEFHLVNGAGALDRTVNLLVDLLNAKPVPSQVLDGTV
ncbi:capsule biosynthesis protein [Pseudomonas sp. RTC3]|uniref:capsule biosynthesis protein n=1 Tax=unclassified Pseudomonas TaxID=196821 RepID=UPI002AB59E16|nr:MULTISPECIES: capsule biosynthesis protein [unclassified Pseudomonas]MEB0063974.1 capsule biosynthesis protein [Pseudomonas sp. RTC3]MDY7567732.1 capsule biosynthesis protein [Pseudomonas sp. 5C2]MEB0007784.1 capsule biosynthesis protein [Pseudomonas sp. RTB2]MEB0018155.1 capsule biosynthesis protein [Pseudomonas sp. RTB3]MEB0150289.1 capsule biosynthesis protein [Pseudomonas sp. CCC2.2]